MLPRLPAAGRLYQYATISAVALIRTPSKLALVFVLNWAVVIAIQYVSGAFQSELAHWPDEPSHAASALMVRDFVASNPFRNPIPFAENFYAHYPKPAVGIWPPVYYLVSGIWLLVFGASKTALLVFSGVVTAVFATVFALFAAKLIGWPAATGLSVLLVTLPQVQWGSSLVMLDVPVALMQFLSMWCFVRFAQTGRTSAALGFAVVVAIATLVKGNANSMVLVPVFYILLTGSWSLLRKKALYICAAVTAALALPWQLVTLQMMRSSGLGAEFTLDYVLRMLVAYTGILYGAVGPAIFLISMLGLAMECVQMRQKKERLSIEMACTVSLFFSVFWFHVIVPIPRGPDDRYMLAAFPCLLLCFASGVRWIVQRIPGTSLSPAYRAIIVAGISVAVFVQTSFAVTRRPKLGFSEVAKVLSDGHLKKDTVLVCSDGIGEGALVVEVAFLDQRPQHVILRGNKLLSDNRWDETDHKPVFRSVSELSNYLSEIGVDSVVIDWTKVTWPQDRELLRQVVTDHSASWREIYDSPGENGMRHLTLYRRENIDRTKPRVKTRIRMPYTYGRDIEVNP